AVVLVDVREPGNAGTIVRGAEAAGATAVVFCRGSADPFAPKVVRASAGALFHVPVVVGGEPGEVLDVLAQRGVRRLGTAVNAGVSYTELDWTVPTAIVVGNEAWGLPPTAPVDAMVTIPMPGRSESLNVAMATAILLFEAARQRARSAP
ncbi:MAG TPA: RNA methyltransferase, partial [Acidimicrobiia bacterium]|nr:RNA methyltransferase [Acidimicrobiia bacterium]